MWFWLTKETRNFSFYSMQKQTRGWRAGFHFQRSLTTANMRKSAKKRLAQKRAAYCRTRNIAVIWICFISTNNSKIKRRGMRFFAFPFVFSFYCVVREISWLIPTRKYILKLWSFGCVFVCFHIRFWAVFRKFRPFNLQSGVKMWCHQNCQISKSGSK